MRRCIYVIIRETGVLILGLLFSLVVWMVFQQNRPLPQRVQINHPILALFVPIILCFVRAGFVPKTSAEHSWLRSTCYQVLIALALIVLMVFEMAVALLFGVKGIPSAVWASILGIGGGYVLLFCIADRISKTDHRYEWDRSDEIQEDSHVPFDELKDELN